MHFSEGSSAIAQHPGFSDWKNGERNLSRHENSAEHRESITTLYIRECFQARHYWTNILRRAAVLYLGHSQGVFYGQIDPRNVLCTYGLSIARSRIVNSEICTTSNF